MASQGEEFDCAFTPSGTYFPESGIYMTKLIFEAKSPTNGEPIVRVECDATFEFGEPLPFENLPNYFFANSSAIIYPYIRAFISTLTLQANYPPFVLPTLNVSSLGKELRNNTNLG